MLLVILTVACFLVVECLELVLDLAAVSITIIGIIRLDKVLNKITIPSHHMDDDVEMVALSLTCTSFCAFGWIKVERKWLKMKNNKD